MISNTVVVVMIHDLRIHLSEVSTLLREHTIKYICKEVTAEKLFKNSTLISQNKV